MQTEIFLNEDMFFLNTQNTVFLMIVQNYIWFSTGCVQFCFLNEKSNVYLFFSNTQMFTIDKYAYIVILVQEMTN